MDTLSCVLETLAATITVVLRWLLLYSVVVPWCRRQKFSFQLKSAPTVDLSPPKRQEPVFFVSSWLDPKSFLALLLKQRTSLKGLTTTQNKVGWSFLCCCCFCLLSLLRQMHTFHLVIVLTSHSISRHTRCCSSGAKKTGPFFMQMGAAAFVGVGEGEFEASERFLITDLSNLLDGTFQLIMCESRNPICLPCSVMDNESWI